MLCILLLKDKVYSKRLLMIVCLIIDQQVDTDKQQIQAKIIR